LSLQGGWYASRDACDVRELVAHIVVNLHLVEVLGMMVKTKGIKEGANEKSGRWTEVIMATWAPWLLSCTRFAVDVMIILLSLPRYFHSPRRPFTILQRTHRIPYSST